MRYPTREYQRDSPSDLLLRRPQGIKPKKKLVKIRGYGLTRKVISALSECRIDSYLSFTQVDTNKPHALHDGTLRKIAPCQRTAHRVGETISLTGNSQPLKVQYQIKSRLIHII